MADEQSKRSSARRVAALGRHLQHAAASPVRGPRASPTSGSEPLRPFHLAFPVHDLDAARRFYGTVLGCAEGRSAPELWIDYSLFGHQIVAHFVSKDYRAAAHFNPVSQDEVPVPHFGMVLTMEQFKALAARLESSGSEVDWVIRPTLRWPGQPGEQWTMFFRDPSGNALEFKSMANDDNLFAKYEVHE